MRDGLGKKIIPLLHKPCTLPSSFNLQFGRFQRIDFTVGEYQASLSKLVGSIKALKPVKQQENVDKPIQVALKRIENVRNNVFSSVAIDGLNLSTLPDELFSLEDINNLDISRNRLSTIPLEICQYTKLRKLHLGSNEFTELPLCLFRLKQLTHLYINDNKISTIPAEISQLQNLEMLRSEQQSTICFAS